MLLRSCDPFTRSFYRDVLGVEQPEPLPPSPVEKPTIEVLPSWKHPFIHAALFSEEAPHTAMCMLVLGWSACWKCRAPMVFAFGTVLRGMQHAIPPPTGYGDDADSLGSFYRLNPKAPKKDFNRLMERDGEVCPRAIRTRCMRT